MKVPEWKSFYPSLQSATKEQKSFFYYWVKQISLGYFIDLQDNLSYVFVFLYESVRDFCNNKDLKSFINDLDTIDRLYSNNSTVKLYICIWKSDAYLLYKEYENAWLAKKNIRIDIFDFLFIKPKCSDTSISADEALIYLASNHKLTKFGKANIEFIKIVFDCLLKDFKYENNKNIIKFYTDKISNFDNCYHKYLFNGCVLSDMPPYIKVPHSINDISIELSKCLNDLLRESENIVREERSLPKVGEGWISETELFYMIKQKFSQEKIIHHGKPHWLGRQHLDIYFTEKNIGIEYQGRQHQEPVGYFGGLEAFKKQQQRDKNKYNLCKKNNCALIYVYEGDDINVIFEKIINLL